MARISTPAVSTKMYRHFAVVTLAVTLLVGIFSSGENRQAMAQAVENQKEAAEAAEFKDYKYGKPHFVETKLQARVYNSNSDYQDLYSDYGEPTDRVGSRAESGVVSSAGTLTRGNGRYVPASYAAHQLSEEELAKLTPAQREALLAQMANGRPAVDQDERQKQINTLVSASAHRSGSDNGLE